MTRRTRRWDQRFASDIFLAQTKSPNTKKSIRKQRWNKNAQNWNFNVNYLQFIHLRFRFIHLNKTSEWNKLMNEQQGDAFVILHRAWSRQQMLLNLKVQRRSKGRGMIPWPALLRYAIALKNRFCLFSLLPFFQKFIRRVQCANFNIFKLTRA